MLKRDAGAASADEIAEGFAFLLPERSVELEIEFEALDPENMGKEVLGIESGGFHPLFSQKFGGTLENLQQRHHGRHHPQLPSEADCSRRSWVSAASMAEIRSAISPSMTRSRL
jgi:hypothetical protein